MHDAIVGIVKQEQREVRAGRPYSVSKSSVRRWMMAAVPIAWPRPR